MLVEEWTQAYQGVETEEEVTASFDWYPGLGVHNASALSRLIENFLTTDSRYVSTDDERVRVLDTGPLLITLGRRGGYTYATRLFRDRNPHFRFVYVSDVPLSTMTHLLGSETQSCWYANTLGSSPWDLRVRGRSLQGVIAEVSAAALPNLDLTHIQAFSRQGEPVKVVLMCRDLMGDEQSDDSIVTQAFAPKPTTFERLLKEHRASRERSRVSSSIDWSNYNRHNRRRARRSQDL